MTTGTAIDGSGPQARKVGVGLGIGVLLLPIVFAWFLLRKGYSNRARVIGFGWMALALLPVIFGGGGTPTSTTSRPSDGGGKTFSQTMTDAALNPQMNAITDKVARDSVDEYNITRSGGDKIEICVQASMVAAAYKQAKDEANYLLWKQKERNDCQDAGMPRR